MLSSACSAQEAQPDPAALEMAAQAQQLLEHAQQAQHAADTQQAAAREAAEAAARREREAEARVAAAAAQAAAAEEELSRCGVIQAAALHLVLVLRAWAGRCTAEQAVHPFCLGSSPPPPAAARQHSRALQLSLTPSLPLSLPHDRLRQEQEQRAAKFSVLHSTFAKKEAALREAAEEAEAEVATTRAQMMELAAEVAASQRCVQCAWSWGGLGRGCCCCWRVIGSLDKPSAVGAPGSRVWVPCSSTSGAWRALPCNDCSGATSRRAMCRHGGLLPLCRRAEEAEGSLATAVAAAVGPLQEDLSALRQELAASQQAADAALAQLEQQAGDLAATRQAAAATDAAEQAASERAQAAAMGLAAAEARAQALEGELGQTHRLCDQLRQQLDDAAAEREQLAARLADGGNGAGGGGEAAAAGAGEQGASDAAVPAVNEAQVAALQGELEALRSQVQHADKRVAAAAATQVRWWCLGLVLGVFEGGGGGI